MFDVQVVFVLLLPGVTSFMIHNTHHSLCLEDSTPAGTVLLKKCRVDLDSQQWVWVNQGMLMCVASSRCLSAQHGDPVHTQWCHGPEVDTAGLIWDCDRDRLISRNTSTLLSIDGRRLTLSQASKHSRWRSLDGGDICQEKLRSRRASDDQDRLAEGHVGNQVAMTDEQRQYLRWFYRTEDQTIWTFVLLGLAFICLLLGFLLLGMGAMASKNRRKIAKYKAAAALVHKCELEELRVLSQLRDGSTSTPSPQRAQQGAQPSPFNGDVNELKAGSIMVTWKDGNTSCLYSDPVAETEQLEGKEEEPPAVEEDLEVEAAAEVDVS